MPAHTLIDGLLAGGAGVVIARVAPNLFKGAIAIIASKQAEQRLVLDTEKDWREERKAIIAERDSNYTALEAERAEHRKLQIAEQERELRCVRVGRPCELITIGNIVPAFIELPAPKEITETHERKENTDP